jgi:DNA repair exonuclease SbcCD nuclease subunit
MSLRILRVGDPHAKVGNLDEMKNLIIFIGQMAVKYGVDRIELLGDLFHTHAIIRLEVLMFWNWALEYLSNICEVVVLVGNHDISGDLSSDVSALTLFGLMNRPKLVIVDKPTRLGVFGYVPYTHDLDKFVRSAESLALEGAKVLVCHQTLDGSKYESGMFAPDGFPVGDWAKAFIHIFSGHIHSEQEFGNITYPGTARWDSVSDANLRKGVWLYNHEDSSGASLSREFIGTEEVCCPIQSVEWREGEPEPVLRDGKNSKVTVELIGSSVWVAQEKLKLKGKCSVKTKITDKKNRTTRSKGDNLEHFLTNLFTTKVDKTDLIKYAKEIGVV